MKLLPRGKKRTGPFSVDRKGNCLSKAVSWWQILKEGSWLKSIFGVDKTLRRRKREPITEIKRKETHESSVRLRQEKGSSDIRREKKKEKINLVQNKGLKGTFVRGRRC